MRASMGVALAYAPCLGSPRQKFQRSLAETRWSQRCRRPVRRKIWDVTAFTRGERDEPEVCVDRAVSLIMTSDRLLLTNPEADNLGLIIW
jgi:hypothetical protein